MEKTKEKKVDKWAWFLAGLCCGMIIAFIIDSILFYLLNLTC